ncbi:MAG: thioredoxin family protein [Bacteroidota bacterium]
MATSIKVLGPGCARCKATFEVVKKAVAQTNVQAEVIKVEDLEGMMKYDIISTPVVVVNEQIKISGRVPTVEEVAALLQ